MKLIKLLVLACLSLVSVAQAQDAAWPPATVKIVVPYPPGSEPDVLARELATLMSGKTGKAFVVENKPGANAIIGTETVARAAGDGSTLLMVDRLAVVTNPILYSKLPYNSDQDLRPVVDLASVQLFLALGENFPPKTYKEFVAYAKARPGEVNVGIAGVGHINHIAMAMLEHTEGFRVTYVAYKGMSPTVTGLLGGQVQALLGGGLVAQNMLKVKPIKLVAVGNDSRVPFLPDVPTIVEAGGKAGTIPATTFSLFMPGTASLQLAQQVAAGFASAIDADFVKRYASRGVEVKPTNPTDMAAAMQREKDRYGRLLQSIGMKIE